MRMKLGGLSLLALAIVGHPLRSRESLVVSAEDGETQDEKASAPDAQRRPAFGKEWEGRARASAPFHSHGSREAGSSGGSDEQCKHLDTDDELVYSQLEAEGSNNDLLKKVNGIINSKLEGVTSVSVVLRGEGINRRVGRFEAKAVITRRSASGADVEQCLYIPYEIRDTDECSLPVGHEMRHKCHASTVCMNTSGSYECMCAKGYWGEEGSGSPSLDRPLRSGDGQCGGESSTEMCCGTFGERRERREVCRQDFRCTNDPCKGHACDENSWCTPGAGYKKYTCECKDGFKKDERGDCVKDVREAVNFCKNHSCPYHCRCSVEENGYRCAPRPGFKAYEDDETVPSDYYLTSPNGRRLDRITRCVDKRTPDISIKGPNPITYRQGDTYEELGVTVTDKNEDDSTRTVKIEYSQPFGAYFKKTGEFTVRYSLENRLLSGLISKTRYVNVFDVDECTYQGPHPEFRHMCAPEAMCRNTEGSYECMCVDGYAGDGRITGTGCRDVTPPIITCVGPGCLPAKFRACNCVGMVSDDGSKRYLPKTLDDAAIEANIKLLKGDMCGYGVDEDDAALAGLQGSGDGEASQGSGAELDDREWKPEKCFSAVDVQYGGKVVDLSRNITMGKLEKAPGLERVWRVPHYVKDAAGNFASTVYYYIEVEEVDVLSTIYGTAETLRRDGFERQLLWVALALMTAWVLLPVLIKVGVALNVVMAAAKVLFFPYSMMSSREEFELGYGFLLRVRAMGMGNEIDRERSIAAYWAELLDKANTGGMLRDED